ncbi:hypothetical protein TBLA_0E00270 [Henningerozyma blattae CBS 6284]|uniref:ATP-grasp domain-containing protein n=1 Tax=Henningerozyma blattae (strain ATCC 34711 / CBS 6284 / DSM 70876 / NBRC 10599 / NRRL Y-10934 / UCD 77-7) TaxID=1071380 RepID=I2H3Y7_HENB6|nr:hypothetical protein TBLA_0E00270 [Tetrapisispora blattae CBS 6284]CCH61089.1 hypothetical protein TBLA_0E00270 [Tetrapisispora blattae CBS 6284]
MSSSAKTLTLLVLGSGGREHALLWRLAQSSVVTTIYVAPGNPGMIPRDNNTGSQAELVALPQFGTTPEHFPALVSFASSHNVDLVIPGPEQPLIDGVADAFRHSGIAVFGPSREAAQLEASKTFAKDFMDRWNIPTASYANFTSCEKALQYIRSLSEFPVVVKADGVAAGKGVLIAMTLGEAEQAVKTIMVERRFGQAGDSVVIEQFLVGQELSVLTITDGFTHVNLPPAQDHKRIGDGDTGLNTGGMGAYAPAPVATPQLMSEIDSTIIAPTIAGMRRDARPFVGVLFTGLILTEKGPRVLEYNTRMGDPETQAVLPLVSRETDFARLLLAAATNCLDSVPLRILQDKFSTAIVMSSHGYPESNYQRGDVITVDPAFYQLTNTQLFYAGVSLSDNNELITSGGRVLAISSMADSIKQSVDNAYKAVKLVNFSRCYYRKDIAHNALENDTTSPAQITYADSGVSVDNGNALVQQIKAKVKSTTRPGSDADIGGFGGVFDLHAAGFPNASESLLVAATDGVGTKLIIAQETGIHNTVGVDLVAMNVNDLVVQGAEPLFFLDYFATGNLELPIAVDFVSGVADGCIQSGCSLVGGETSEMPGMYPPGHYDTNGTAVGAVLKKNILPKKLQMSEGDVLLGLASDGVHSNGFSLVRKIVQHANVNWSDPCPWDNKNTFGEAILTPTRIYVKQLLPVINQQLVLGLAHITGGGLVENIPRALPDELQAVVDMNAWKLPEVFKWFGKAGNVPIDDILKTFNMGIGMVVILKQENVAKVTSLLESAGETVYKIGQLQKKPSNEPGCVVRNAIDLY